MSVVAFPFEVLDDDLVGCEPWTSALEGPYTRVAKLALLNALDAKSLCELLFGRRLLPGSFAQVHGRSFLSSGSRRAAAEKLLNWACFQQDKAVSSLVAGDFAAFSRFLADPQPAERWLSVGRISRDSIRWRPFRGPLSLCARRTTMAHVASLVKWLALQRYADLDCRVGSRSMNDGCSDAALSEAAHRERRHIEAIGADEWHWVRGALDERFPAGDVAPQRLTVELLYYGDLYVNEIARLSIRDLQPPNRLSPGWCVHVTSRAPWRGGTTVYAPPPLSRTLGLLANQHEPERDGIVTVRLRGGMEPVLAADVSALCRYAQQVIRHAARLALDAGQVELDMRLRERSVVAFRRAFAMHQRHTAVDAAAFDLTGALAFNEAILEQALGQARAPQLWEWSRAAHVWADTA